MTYSEHHCGFDFVNGQEFAGCKCGAVASNRNNMNEFRKGYYHMGRIEEQERIIELLKSHPCYSLESCQQGCITHDLLVGNIKLIKGETE